MDPQIILNDATTDELKCIRDVFVYGKTDITQYDAVVAQGPCETAEHIIRECVEKKKDFAVSLCGVPYRLMNGEMPEDVYAWYRYLAEVDPDNCILARPRLIPGYLSHVMIGKFI